MDATTETREQYQERIGKIAYDEYMLSADFTPDWPALTDAAEAVAAQVLRDVLALARVDELGWQKVRLIQANQIERFARERGIDLDGDA